MSQVTVKATQGHSFLLMGQVATVERTEFIDRLIEQEQLVVVDPADAPAPTTDQSAALNTKLLEPPRNGAGSGRDPWAAFVRQQLPAFAITPDTTRAELIEAWDQSLAAPVPPAGEDPAGGDVDGTNPHTDPQDPNGDVQVATGVVADNDDADPTDQVSPDPTS